MAIEETYRGIVHGSIIQLNQSIDIPDGMEVDVVIKRPVLDASERTKKLLSLFGGCKDDAEDLDEYMAWNDQQRKQDRPIGRSCSQMSN